MADLSVKIAGLDFQNPVMVAAITPNGPWNRWTPEKDAPAIMMKQWRKYYEAGVGAICTGIVLPDDDTSYTKGAVRFWRTNNKGKPEGLMTVASFPDAALTRTSSLEVIRRAKKEFTDVRIIANMPAGEFPDEVAIKLAQDCEQAGADMIELNFGCGMMIGNIGQALKAMEDKDEIPSGIAIGLVPDIASRAAKKVKDSIGIPVAVKITPELALFQMLKALPLYIKAGVSAFTANHSFLTVPPPDIYNGGKTSFPNMETTALFMSQGPWHRFATYRNVAMICKYFKDSDVMACAGLTTPEQCIEVMMFGARAVQLSSGIFINGVSFPGKVLDFMKAYMKDQGYGSARDFIGLGQKYLVEMEECQQEFKPQVGRLIAVIDRDKCVGLSKCKICMDNWCYATYGEDDKPMVDRNLCSSCNLCVIRCPHGARTLQYID